MLILLDQTEVCITMQAVVSLYDNGIKIYQFIPKDSEIRPYQLCFGNISKDFSADNMKKPWIERIHVPFFC